MLRRRGDAYIPLTISEGTYLTIIHTAQVDMSCVGWRTNGAINNCELVNRRERSLHAALACAMTKAAF